MAMVWTESCQHLRDSATALHRYWDLAGAFNSTAGRNGGPAFGMRAVAYPQFPAPSGTTFLCSVRTRWNGGSGEIVCGPGVDIVGVSNVIGSLPTLHCGLVITETGALQVQRGSTVLAATGAAFVSRTIHGFTVKFVIDGSTGSAEVWMDGVHVAALDCSGVNTKNLAGSANWNSFQVGATLNTHQWCDLVVCDGSGTAPNTIAEILEARVDTFFPNGNGNYSQFDGSDGNGADNYLLVDENDPNGDEDYVESAAAAKDSYTIEDVPTGATIIGVTAYADARKTDAGVAQMKLGVRLSGTDYMDASARSLGVDYTHQTRCMGRNPATGNAWTEAEVNASEVVIEKV